MARKYCIRFAAVLTITGSLLGCAGGAGIDPCANIPDGSRFGDKWERGGFTLRPTWHRGIDVAVPRFGTPLFAPAAGIVTGSGFRKHTDREYSSNFITIFHGRDGSGSYVFSEYYHTRGLLRSGQQVSTGDRFAVVDDSGRTGYPHTHMNVWVRFGDDPFPELTEQLAAGSEITVTDELISALESFASPRDNLMVRRNPEKFGLGGKGYLPPNPGGSSSRFDGVFRGFVCPVR